jgi:hypothetical protein
MGQAKGQPEVRFFFYLEGRSLEAQGKAYFLPYDARLGAASTYIGKAELDRWWKGIQFEGAYMKAYIWAMRIPRNIGCNYLISLTELEIKDKY